MVRISKNKKGVSMMEVIAYVILYGAVMALIGTLTFTIIQSARKVNRQAILNRGATMIYTEILSQTVSLSPDFVNDVATTTVDGKEVVSITFEKKYYYTDEGEKKSIADSTEYNDKLTKITYSYTAESDNINIVFEKGNGGTTNSTIDLDYGMTITAVEGTSISKVFSVDSQNSSNKYVTFHGNLNFDSKTMEFNFIIPVFTAS